MSGRGRTGFAGRRQAQIGGGRRRDLGRAQRGLGRAQGKIGFVFLGVAERRARTAQGGSSVNARGRLDVGTGVSLTTGSPPSSPLGLRLRVFAVAEEREVAVPALALAVAHTLPHLVLPGALALLEAGDLAQGLGTRTRGRIGSERALGQGRHVRAAGGAAFLTAGKAAHHRRDSSWAARARHARRLAVQRALRPAGGAGARRDRRPPAGPRGPGPPARPPRRPRRGGAGPRRARARRPSAAPATAAAWSDRGEGGRVNPNRSRSQLEKTPAPRTTRTIVDAAAKARRDQLTALTRATGMRHRLRERRLDAIEASAARVEPIEQRRGVVAIAAFRDHGLQGRARDREVALLERALRLVKTLVVAALRLGDGGAGGGETAERLGRGGLHERDPAEHACGFTRVARLEQSPALGAGVPDPVAVGRCHYMVPRIEAATLSRKAVRAFQGESFDRGSRGDRRRPRGTRPQRAQRR